MRTMLVPFFKNNFRCTEHSQCGIGASCAIDVLLELYYFGVFKNTSNQEILSNRLGLIGHLNSTSRLREVNQSPTCMMRKPVWKWLVDNIPNAYSPKGRPDAEILEALRRIGKEPGFFIKKEPACCKCGQVSPLEDLVVPSPLPITFTVAESVYGHIPDAVSASLMQYKCKGCKESKVENILLPEFLMLEIGLVNYRNRQDPPILIPEEFHLCEDLSYKLVGAVMV